MQGGQSQSIRVASFCLTVRVRQDGPHEAVMAEAP